MRRILSVLALVAATAALGAPNLSAQGVTTSSVTGIVTTTAGTPISGASVLAVHAPSGTRYQGLTRADGRYVIPGMRVGGPYTITVSSIGYATQAREDVVLNLGVATDVDFRMADQALALEGITVTSEADAIISSERTGAGTAVSREAISVLPSISGRIEDFIRLTPQSSGFSFAGADARLNNVTVDGSYFNNSFGLGGSAEPGGRTGVAPISLDAIEQIQVNVAPYDVRQGNFVGAGVNTVTRSGGNEFRGSLRTLYRTESFVGDDAGGSPVNPGTFNFRDIGGWVSGPIIQDRLFFFVNYENASLNEPGTTFRANRGGEAIEGSVTRVLASDLDQLSTFLQQNFGYETGPYQDYDHETPATRFLAKLDYNLDDRNKLSLRYSHLDSFTDVLLSNSSSLGLGTRRTNLDGLNFRNSNYQILENIRSIVGEWNSIIGANMSNSLIVGYTSHDESRDTRGGDFFPMVDIQEAGSIYTTFGFEPFTPNNELRYSSFQLQNNFSRFGDRHSQTFGASIERYESENVFFPGSQSVYSYNSLQDFYTDAQDYLANPNRTTSPVQLARFQVRWSNIPGQDKPIQPLEVFYAGLYGQNEWRATPDLRITAGLRIDAPFFGDTGFENAQVDGFSFRDENGQTVRYSTAKLPDANLLFSPRLGFNWDVGGERTTQVRGGTGIFTGRPAYVWISNQIGENGVLTGFEQINNTTARPFNPDPDHYKPTTVTGDPAASYGLAFSDPSFRFPQIWRSNVGVDQRLPGGVIATADFLYARDVNGVYYINANLAQPNNQFSGADTRARWTAGNRINSNVTSAVVLKNQNEGYSWNAAVSLEKPFDAGLYLKGAYSYGVAKNTVDPGSIAFGSWNNNPHTGDPNNPDVAYSVTSPGHRFFVVASYRRDWLPIGATTLTVFTEGRTPFRGSYVFGGDINGDGGTSNDLIYIHRDVSEMNFQEYSAGGRTFTAQEQAQAWDRYIQQDPYLSQNRGQYAERNGVQIPVRWLTDVSVQQEISRNIGGNQNRLSVRADILNFMNLLSSDWGVGQTFVNTQPLIVPTAAQGGPADSQGRAQYRLRNIGGELMSESFRPTAGIGDVWRVQLGLRYSFN
jgi:hypothetical protein